MPTTTGTVQLTLQTKRLAPTEDVHSAGNEPTQWVPNVFFSYSVTITPTGSEESGWADLAAHARATWGRDNPF